MSASSKKKLRKEQNAAAMTEKQLKEAKEAKKLKVLSISFAVVMVLVLCIAVGIGVTTLYTRSGISERNTTALTVGEHELNSADMNYYFVDAVNNTYGEWNNSYGSYVSMYVELLYGLDITAPLDQQTYISDESMTWADYFTEMAITNAKANYALYDMAVAEGRELTEEEQASIDTTMEYMSLYASIYGYSDTEAYLKAIYGNGATEKSYREYCEVYTLSSGYYNDYADALTYDDAANRAYEESRYDEYSSFSYASYYLAYSNFLEGGTTDKEGNTTYSDEEKADALAEAKAVAESLTAATTVDELDEAIAALEINANTTASSSKYEDTIYTDISTALQEWLADDSRKAGDIAVIANESTANDENGNETTTTLGYYVVMFQDRNDNTMPLVNVRHILSSFEGGTTDETGATTYSDEEKQAAYNALNEVYTTWKSGDATEDSFAALAADNSDDTGSSSNGGLYEDVYPGQMVTNFNDWCFDESRKPGDTEIIETNYGYHLMYYVGESDTTYRDSMITEDMLNEDLDAWYSAIVDAVACTEGNTSKLSRDMIISSSSN